MEAAAAGNGFERGGGDGLELQQAAAGEMGGGEGREERWTRQRGRFGRGAGWRKESGNPKYKHNSCNPCFEIAFGAIIDGECMEQDGCLQQCSVPDLHFATTF